MADPIVSQPVGDSFGFTPKPQLGSPGLGALQSLKSVTIHQRWPKCLELLGCWEYKNHYRILDEFGEHVMLAKEESSCMDRWLCANSRPFEMSLVDKSENEVLRFQRPLRCMFCPFSCCYPDLLQSLTVTSNGQFLGRIQEPAFCCSIRLEVFGQDDQTKKFEIVNSICSLMCTCCSDLDYPILNESGVEVGSVTWKFKGCAKSVMTDSDSFVVTFPPDISVEDKALLIAATMLLDFMYYERQNNDG